MRAGLLHGLYRRRQNDAWGILGNATEWVRNRCHVAPHMQLDKRAIIGDSHYRLNLSSAIAHIRYVLRFALWPGSQIADQIRGDANVGRRKYRRNGYMLIALLGESLTLSATAVSSFKQRSLEPEYWNMPLTQLILEATRSNLHR